MVNWNKSKFGNVDRLIEDAEVEILKIDIDLEKEVYPQHHHKEFVKEEDNARQLSFVSDERSKFNVEAKSWD